MVTLLPVHHESDLRQSFSAVEKRMAAATDLGQYPVADQDIADASTVRSLAVDTLIEMRQNGDVSAWFTNYPRTGVSGAWHLWVLALCLNCPFQLSVMSSATCNAVAARHDVTLVPKRVFLSIIVGSDSTLDTIHPSQPGRQFMADGVWRLVKSAF